MPFELPEFVDHHVGNDRPGDLAEVLTMRQVDHLTYLPKDRGHCDVKEQDGRLELGAEIVGEAVEEAPEHRVRPLQRRNPAIVRGGERRDVATDRGVEGNIGQDEYRLPVAGHILGQVWGVAAVTEANAKLFIWDN